MSWEGWRIECTATSVLAALLLSSCASGPPRDYIERHDRGVGEFQDKEFAASKSTFEKLLADYPDGPLNPGIRLRIATCDFFLGNLENARREYREIIDSLDDPALKSLALQSLGDLEARAENHTAAAAYYRQALELETEPEVRHGIEQRLGVCLQQGGEFAEARRVFEGIIAQAPGSPAAAAARQRLLLPDYFTVQVGAYADRANAERQVTALKRAGFAARIEPPEDPARPLFHVRVGEFRTRAQANATRARLADSSALPAGDKPIVLP
jgi:tetratricopeptide (TPR) repeat protein